MEDTDAATLEAPETTSVFDSIPNDFPAKPPLRVPEPEVKTPEPLKDAPKEPQPEAKETPKETPKEPEPEKKPSDYARERRERKAKADMFDSLAKEKETLEQTVTETETELERLRREREELANRSTLSEDEAKALRERAEAAERRYVAAHTAQPDFERDTVLAQHKQGFVTALKSNLPRRVQGDNGTVRINVDGVMGDRARAGHVETAVALYADAISKGDDKAISKAIVTMGTAFGLDADEHEEAIEDALVAASEHFTAAIGRQQEIVRTAHQTATQRRNERIAEVEQRFYQPLAVDPQRVDEVLAEEPDNPYANFAKLTARIPEEVLKEVRDDLSRDAAVAGGLQFTPPPLPAGASAEDIERHNQSMVAASGHLNELITMASIGRILIGSGVLPHLLAGSKAAHDRLEQTAGSLAIPGGPETRVKGAGEPSAWEAIPTDFPR